MFWALFGLSSERKVELQGFPSRFTESVGYIVFGVYYWAVVIILLNMLIAMMTRSFEKITVTNIPSGAGTLYKASPENQKLVHLVRSFCGCRGSRTLSGSSRARNSTWSTSRRAPPSPSPSTSSLRQSQVSDVKTKGTIMVRGR